MKSLRFRLLLLTTFLLVFPFFLRRRPRVERQITILAPPAAIFPFLNDLRNWPLWTAWSRRENLRHFYNETPSGAGAEQRWEGHCTSGVVRILKSETDARIDYEVTMSGGMPPLLGRLELHADGACTRLVWKGAWDLSEQPYRRYFDLFLRWMLRRDLAEGLTRLKALVEGAEGPTESRV